MDFDPGNNDPEGNVTGETGDLTLDFVPAIAFGSNEIDGVTEKTYQSTTARPFVQVTDRRGTNSGWELSMRLGEFQDVEENVSLEGSTLTLTGGEAVTSDENLSQTPDVSTPVSVTAGGETALVTKANANEGAGSWITRWIGTQERNEKVTLTVPAGASKPGTHTAVITWTLSAAP